MRDQKCNFLEIVTKIADVDALRENVRLQAFGSLERQASALANMALYTLGDRARAAQWMCLRQRVLDGRSPYEVLAEGDLDRVWDLLTGSSEEW